MNNNDSIKTFVDRLTPTQQVEFGELKDKKNPIAIFLIWFTHYGWKHCVQKDFLNAMVQLFPREEVSDARLFATYKKHLQRIKNASPEEKQKILIRTPSQLHKDYLNSIAKLHNYKAPITPLTLLGYPAIFDDKVRAEIEVETDKTLKLYLGEHGFLMVKEIDFEIQKKLDDFATYHLARTGLQAHARWTDESNSNGVLIPPKQRKGKGVFLVLSDSQLVKTEVASCLKFKRIVALRQKLIASDVLRDDGDVYTFISDYPFSSASLAASVLAGANLNGLQYWKDEYGRSLGQFRKGKFKTKRGPGRPRKSS